MNKEFTITSDKNTIYIKGVIQNNVYHRLHILSIKDVMAYKVKIQKDVADLHTDYKHFEMDTFYKLVITSNNYDGVELIYNDRDEIVNDETIILNFISQYQAESKAERERLLRYEMMD